MGLSSGISCGDLALLLFDNISSVGCLCVAYQVARLTEHLGCRLTTGQFHSAVDTYYF